MQGLEIVNDTRTPVQLAENHLSLISYSRRSYSRPRPMQPGKVRLYFSLEQRQSISTFR